MNDLNSLVVYTPIVTGVWSVSIALIVHASGGLLSKLIFKVIPFFLGMASLYSGSVLIGWL